MRGVLNLESDGLTIVCVVAVALASAWISIFNLEQLLVGRQLEGWGELLGFSLLIIGAGWVSIVFMMIHFADVKYSAKGYDRTEPFLFGQALSFLVLYVALWFRR